MSKKLFKRLIVKASTPVPKDWVATGKLYLTALTVYIRGVAKILVMA